MRSTISRSLCPDLSQYETALSICMSSITRVLRSDPLCMYSAAISTHFAKWYMDASSNAAPRLRSASRLSRYGPSSSPCMRRRRRIDSAARSRSSREDFFTNSTIADSIDENTTSRQPSPVCLISPQSLASACACSPFSPRYAYESVLSRCSTRSASSSGSGSALKSCRQSPHSSWNLFLDALSEGLSNACGHRPMMATSCDKIASRMLSCSPDPGSAPSLLPTKICLAESMSFLWPLIKSSSASAVMFRPPSPLSRPVCRARTARG